MGGLHPSLPAGDTPTPSVNNHGVPALEALLPAKVGAVALERLSLTGPDFYSLGTDATRAQLDTMLAKLGKKVTDLTVGDAGDPSGLTVIEIGAFRVAAAPAGPAAVRMGGLDRGLEARRDRHLQRDGRWPQADQARRLEPPGGRGDLRVRQRRHAVRHRRGRPGAPVKCSVAASNPVTFGSGRA